MQLLILKFSLHHHLFPFKFELQNKVKKIKTEVEVELRTEHRLVTVRLDNIRVMLERRKEYEKAKQNHTKNYQNKNGQKWKSLEKLYTYNKTADI